jgi:hypothetical protein
MHERAAVLGGTLTAAPTADGGFLVEAALPAGEGSPEPPEVQPVFQEAE